MCKLVLYLVCFLVSFVHVLGKSLYPHLQCRDPELGHGHDQSANRKFLIMQGNGGGIGNYLIFYPALFYFAALTGRVRRFY